MRPGSTIMSGAAAREAGSGVRWRSRRSDIQEQPGGLRLPVALVPGDLPLVLESQGDLVEPFEEALLGERTDVERISLAVRAGHRLCGEICGKECRSRWSPYH